MKAVSRTLCLAACLALFACGNKGDLYLEEAELTEEQKAMLDELSTDKAKKKKPNSTQISQ